MDSKSRSGRFDLSANKLVEDFNATIMIEQRNCPFDIKGLSSARHYARSSRHYQPRRR